MNYNNAGQSDGDTAAGSQKVALFVEYGCYHNCCQTHCVWVLFCLVLMVFSYNFYTIAKLKENAFKQVYSFALMYC